MKIINYIYDILSCIFGLLFTLMILPPLILYHLIAGRIESFITMRQVKKFTKEKENDV